VSSSKIPGRLVAFNSVLSSRQCVEQQAPRTTRCHDFPIEVEAIRRRVDSPDDSLLPKLHGVGGNQPGGEGNLSRRKPLAPAIEIPRFTVGP